jgi:hypothetical protein
VAISTALQQWGPFFQAAPQGGGRGAPHFSRFGELVRRVREHYHFHNEEARLSGGTDFPLRVCNIQDPLNARNNLGYSLNRQSLQYLQHALAEGRRHLEHLLAWAVMDPTSLPPVAPLPPPPPPLEGLPPASDRSAAAT